jgi:hypothetical protein
LIHRPRRGGNRRVASREGAENIKKLIAIALFALGLSAGLAPLASPVYAGGGGGGNGPSSGN